ncbi:MAG: hypothetical protein PHE96_00485 [Methylococcales bacterium]|nr:hypothetical protein [Methylococcales bacterium]
MSEGVDVPALDAILFLHPRKSQIDVVRQMDDVSNIHLKDRLCILKG